MTSLETMMAGAKIAKFEIGDGYLQLTTDKGTFQQRHEQDCCERVNIHEVKGNLVYLCGKIISVESVESKDNKPETGDADSWTWTYTTITTEHGVVKVTWLGESNGYYSESVEWRIV